MFKQGLLAAPLVYFLTYGVGFCESVNMVSRVASEHANVSMFEVTSSNIDYSTARSQDYQEQLIANGTLSTDYTLDLGNGIIVDCRKAKCLRPDRVANMADWIAQKGAVEQGPTITIGGFEIDCTKAKCLPEDWLARTATLTAPQAPMARAINGQAIPDIDADLDDIPIEILVLIQSKQ